MFARSTLLAFLAVLPFVSQSVHAASCLQTYTVQEGDICDSISAAHNVPTYQLAALNSPIDIGCTDLMPGQKLCLATSAMDCSATHTVEPNDTCDSIASAHGITTAMLSSSNPQIDAICSNIYLGEVLCTVNQAVVSAPPVPSVSSVAATSVSKIVTVFSTPTPSASTSAIPSASASASDDGDSDDGDDGDDGDDWDPSMPYCDEL